MSTVNQPPERRLSTTEQLLQAEDLLEAVREQESLATRNSATTALQKLLPGIVELAKQTENPAVVARTRELQNAVAGNVRTSVPDIIDTIAETSTGSNLADRQKKWAHSLGVGFQNKHQMYARIAKKFDALQEQILSETTAENVEKLSQAALQSVVFRAVEFAAKEYDPDTDGQFEAFAKHLASVCIEAACIASTTEESKDENLGMYAHEGTKAYRSAKGTISQNKMQKVVTSQRAAKFENWSRENAIPGSNYNEQVLAATIAVMPWIISQLEARFCDEGEQQKFVSAMQSYGDKIARCIRNFEPKSADESLIDYLEKHLGEDIRTGNPSAPISDTLEELDLSSREGRLMKWANIHNVYGKTPYDIQGKLIRMHIKTSITICNEVLEGAMQPSDELKTVGFRIIKGLVQIFDPEIHGDSFEAFITPYLKAGIQRAVMTRDFEYVPHRADPEMLESLLTDTNQADEDIHAEPLSTVTTEVASDESEPEPAVEEIATEPEPETIAEDASTEAPAKSAVEGSTTEPVVEDNAIEVKTGSATEQVATEPEPEAVAEDNTIEAAVTPAKVVPNQAPTDAAAEEAEIAERAKQKRFCEWAKGELSVKRIHYEQAVSKIAKKYEGMAKGIVSKMTIPSSYGREKKGLEKVAVRKMPDVVAQYDPGEQEHFNAFVNRVLGSILEAEVK